MKEWYIVRNDKKYGPYTTDEMIQLRQQRKVFEYDLVWKQGLRQWKPLIQTEEFSTQAMVERSLRGEVCEVLNRRQWPRVKKEASLLVHNNVGLWPAKTINISVGGALVELNTPFLNPNDQIHLHFQNNDLDSEHFSCLGTITGKRYTNERLRVNSTIQYNVRFDEKDQNAQGQLENWVQSLLKVKQESLKGA